MSARETARRSSGIRIGIAAATIAYAALLAWMATRAPAYDVPHVRARIARLAQPADAPAQPLPRMPAVEGTRLEMRRDPMR